MVVVGLITRGVDGICQICFMDDRKLDKLTNFSLRKFFGISVLNHIIIYIFWRVFLIMITKIKEIKPKAGDLQLAL